MPPARFLTDYWQKRPLLIHGAFPAVAPLSPDDLGGLGCEEAALSRIIVRNPEHDQWTVHNGPFAEDFFATLPEDHWTLLVQDVDKWDADVAQLLTPFGFLPSWRIDDIMVSYAEDGGGVGAHVDQYDVFLLQGVGRRRWSISTDPQASRAFRDDVELKLLREFRPTHTWTLETGDMLYLPPGVPHEGVADGQCLTFSIGMRAPSHAELLLDLAEHLAEGMDDADRYRDPDLRPARSDGQIDAAALERLTTLLGPLAATLSPADKADWFGGFITRYRSAQLAAPPRRRTTQAALRKAIDRTATLVRHPWTRMVWTAHGRRVRLFVAGEAFDCSRALARTLCAQSELTLDSMPAGNDLALLLELVNRGHLALRRGSRR